MNSKILRRVMMVGLAIVTAAAVAAPVGTGFSYQGELRVAGAPASTPHDFEFALFNVASGGAVILTQTNNDLAVSAGFFTVELDYTEVPFAVSEAYWLEVRVRDGAASGAYTPLLPRQKITPAPYAVNARSVQAGGVNRAAIADGAVGNAQIGLGAVRGIHIENGAVGTDHIAPDAVTGGKIAPFSIDGSDIADNAVQSRHIVFDAVGSVQIQNSSVGASDLALGAVSSGSIQNGAVGRAQLAPAAVGASNIESGAVIGGHLASASVGSSHIAPGAVNALHLEDGAVGTVALASFAVTDAKIANGTITEVKLAFEPGDITGVNASTGLTGGGATGTVALGVNFAAVQARITGVCAFGQYFRGINANGSVACESVPGFPALTTVHDAAAEVGRHTSIAVGADGLPVISYANTTDGTLMVAKCSNSACTGITTITPVDDPVNAVGTYSDIAIGSDGRPVISYYDSTARKLKIAKCSTTDCTGTPLVVTAVDTPGLSFGTDTSIAIRSGQGRPVISARDDTNKALKVVSCEDPNCNSYTGPFTVEDAANDVGHFSSIAIGSDGLPVISYYDLTAQALKVAKCVDFNCSTAITPTFVDNTASNLGASSSIAIGSDGNPIIAYQDITANSLKVAKCNDAACSGVATINTPDDPANLVGEHSSIAIGADGIPVISYYDATAGALKVTRCNNSACTGSVTTTTVDDPANRVGSYTSIAIGADGLPVISYFDVTAGSLKVAKCGTRSCQ